MWRCVVAMVGVLSLAGPAVADDAVVPTDTGPVRGTVTSTYRSFQGIPYAAPPIGDLRWRPPQPVQPWSRPRAATRPGGNCVQVTVTGQPAGGVEDCLYLNVTTPRAPSARPVMVWLHGGGFFQGSGAEYAARRLAGQGDVVVVTINYRLSVYGGFGYRGLPGSGTFGLQDQQAALRWVRRNAAAFGGDARNVTLFGESAGGTSVCAQLTSPRAAGLFAKAIVQSGPCVTEWPKNGLYRGAPQLPPYTARADAERGGADTARELGCDTAPDPVGCLRQIPEAELTKRWWRFTMPAYDTPVLPDDPAAALRIGRFHRVPVLLGGTRDEHAAWAIAFYPGGRPIDEQTYRRFLTEAYGDSAAQVARAYPVRAYDQNPTLAWTSLVTDTAWACPNLTVAGLLARHVPTYAYEFADRHAPPVIPPPFGFPPRASHTAELPYLFDLAGRTWQLAPGQWRLADQLVAQWSHFAYTGRPDWPRFQPAGQYVQSFAPDAINQVNLATEHNCALWATLHP